MSTYANLPAPSPEQGLNRYMQEIRKFPLLEPEEEYMLAKRWVDHQDTAAAHKMVTSHLRDFRSQRGPDAGGEAV
jgi:RNA polymerase sigma-32 factor